MTQDVNRRTLLGAATLALPGIARAQAPVALNFAVWAGPAEQAAYNAVIARYQEAHPNVTIKLEVVPFGAFYQQVDTRLAGRQGPDLFRVQYQAISRYARDKGAIELGPHLGAEYGAQFAPAVWNAVNYNGKPFAVPHHTDTFALYYNVDQMRQIGVEPPRSLAEAWTWAQFIEVAQKLKAARASAYPFAMSWQNGAAYRWLFFLYQHGGALMDANLKAPVIATAPGVETIAWTQSWFRDGLVPPNTSLKSAEPVQNLFANGLIGMMLNGNWQIPFLTSNMKAEWGVTYMPRDVAQASDLGGTCVAVSRDSRNPAVAADFLKFLCDERNMQDFVTSAQFLPVRKSLAVGTLDYKLRPEAMKVFVEQASTVPDHLVRTVSLPNWPRMNLKLADELELAFTSGQSPEATAKNLEEHARTLLK